MDNPKRPLSTREGRQFRTRAEREARIQQWVLRSVVGVSIILVVILAAALIFSQLIAPNEVLARVYDVEITAADFQQRFLLERTLLNNQLNNLVSYYQTLGFSNEEINRQLLNDPRVNAWQNELTVPDQLGIRVIETLAQEALILRVAQEMNLSVDEAEIEEERASFFNFSETTPTAATTMTSTPLPSATPTPILTPTPTPTIAPSPTPSPTPSASPTADSLTTTVSPTNTPSPTLTAAERRQNYETSLAEYTDLLRNQGVSQRILDQYFAARAWRAALQEAVIEEIKETPYVALRHILVSTENLALAEDLLSALEGGEAFSALVSLHSIDSGSNERGGFYDFAPVEADITTYVPEFAKAAREGSVGPFIGPIQTEFGYHIMQVVGRENRATTEQQAEVIRAGNFEKYLDNLVVEEKGSGNYDVRSNWVNHLPG